MAKGDLDGAIAACTKAIELDPTDADAYCTRGIAKNAKGDLVGADADFAQASKLQRRWCTAVPPCILTYQSRVAVESRASTLPCLSTVASS